MLFPNLYLSHQAFYLSITRMDIHQVVGITAGICTAISMLPQLIKIIKEKKAQDISLIYLIVLLTGVGLWIWYGFLKEDAPIIFTNIFSALINIATIIAGVKYKKNSA